jgi:hypothetical protein
MKLSDVFNKTVAGAASMGMGIACAVTFVVPALAATAASIATIVAGTFIGGAYGIYQNKKNSRKPNSP